MKFRVLIILVLGQFTAHGQLSYWTPTTISKNKVKSVSVFRKVPKTNPEYYNKPRGFMAISETKFDSLGQVIEDVCKKCQMCFDCDLRAADVVQKYFYNKGKLTRIEISGFKKSTILFYYDTLKNRNLEIGLDENNERNIVKLKYVDSDGKPTSGYEIAFENISIREDSVIQIFLVKSGIEYKKQAETLKEFGQSTGTNIDRQRFEIFKHSLDFEAISETFESLDYSRLELRINTTIYFDDAGNELKEVDDINGRTISEYQRDKKGLILTEFKYWPVYTAKHEYRYKFRE